MGSSACFLVMFEFDYLPSGERYQQVCSKIVYSGFGPLTASTFDRSYVATVFNTLTWPDASTSTFSECSADSFYESIVSSSLSFSADLVPTARLSEQGTS